MTAKYLGESNSFQYTETVEVHISNATTGKYNLPDNDILRGKTIVGIAIRRQRGSSKSKSPLKRTLISDDALTAGHLYLEADSLRFINGLALDHLATSSDDRGFTAIQAKGFNPTKSYIEFAAVTDLVADQAVEIAFAYED